jgi:hypothetical protein
VILRPYSSILTKILPSAPGCPQPLVEQVLRDSAIRVCERTLTWRYVTPEIKLIPGVPEYAFERPAGSDVFILFSAVLNGQHLSLLTLDQAIATYPKWAELYGGQSLDSVWSGTPSGAFNGSAYNTQTFNGPEEVSVNIDFEGASEPRSLVQVVPQKFLTLPVPDAERDYMLRLVYALKPTKTASGLPPEVFDDLEDAIIHTTLQHLLVIPNVEWTDRDLSVYHGRQALFEMNSRRARANLGILRGALRAVAPRFA